MFLTIFPSAVVAFLWAAALHTARVGYLPGQDQLLIAIRTAGSTVLLTLAVAPLGWPWLAREAIADQLKDH